MLESVVKAYPDLDLGIHVVWAAMLGGDTEEAAREISKMFDDPRVKQYWDPKKLLGTIYSARVYPGYLAAIDEKMKVTYSADHWWHHQGRDWKSIKPEKSPFWDVAFTYDKGATWDKAPPVPRGLVKPLAFYGEQPDGPTGLFFTDFKKAPFDGDWIEELASAMTQLTGRMPKEPSGPSELKPAARRAGCGGDAYQLPFVFKLAGVQDSRKNAVEASVSAMKDVMRATFDTKSKIITILAAPGGTVTNDRLLEFLALAGYEPREPSQSELEQAMIMLWAGGPTSVAAAETVDQTLFDNVATTLSERYFDEAFRRNELPALVYLYRERAALAVSFEGEREVVQEFLANIPASHLALISNASLERIMDELARRSTPSFGFELIEFDGKQYAVNVLEEGPAAVAGLRRGDRIVTVDGADR